MSLNMTPRVTGIGTFIVFIGVVFVVVFFPTIEDTNKPSEIWRERTAIEDEGMVIYMENGCQYCHSMYVRAQDWDYGSNRVSQAGDYHGDRPPLLGSERQGPDLSQEGGLRPDDWHFAHFINPRYTRPDSIMPPYKDLGMDEIKKLTAYIQSLGFKDADLRVARQHYWKKQVQEAYRKDVTKPSDPFSNFDPVKNMEWLHANVPKEWMDLPNPYPADEASLKRGEKIYQHFCIGCHGPVGDGMGPASGYRRDQFGNFDPNMPKMDPPPYNFTYLKNWRGNIGGMFYYQIMNGITGSTMPPFKTELESEKIWDVSNYVAYNFVGRTDTEEGPLGIPSSFEPLRHDEKELLGKQQENKEEGN